MLLAVPPLGPRATSMQVHQWLARPGEQVGAGLPLVEFLCGDVVLRLAAPDPCEIVRVVRLHGPFEAGEPLVELTPAPLAAGTSAASARIRRYLLDYPRPAAPWARASTDTFRIPRLGESVSGGTLTRLHVKPGDAVHADQLIAEIGLDKIDAELLAPADAIVLASLVSEGETVDVDSPYLLVVKVPKLP